MKRIGTALAALALTAMLSGCGTEQPVKVEAHTAGEVSEAGKSAETEQPEKYVITCAELTERVLAGSSAEFPPHMTVTDEIMISDVIGYDTGLVTDSSINVQLVSADLFELTLFRVPDENGDKVLNMLNERKDYLQKQAAYYPAQLEAADAAIVSHTGDMYYLICHKDAANIEKALITEIKYG